MPSVGGVASTAVLSFLFMVLLFRSVAVVEGGDDDDDDDNDLLEIMPQPSLWLFEVEAIDGKKATTMGRGEIIKRAAREVVDLQNRYIIVKKQTVEGQIEYSVSFHFE